MRIATMIAFFMLALCVFIAPKQALAKKGEFALSLSGGTGYLFATTDNKAAESTVSKRHPAVFDIDFQYEILGWFALSMKTQAAVEGGEVATFLPNLVFDSDGDVITGYGRIGAAIVLEPKMYGLTLGAGMVWHFIRHLGLNLEFHAEPLFAGDGVGGGFAMPMVFLLGLRGNV